MDTTNAETKKGLLRNIVWKWDAKGGGIHSSIDGRTVLALDEVFKEVALKEATKRNNIPLEGLTYSVTVSKALWNELERKYNIKLSPDTGSVLKKYPRPFEISSVVDDLSAVKWQPATRSYKSPYIAQGVTAQQAYDLEMSISAAPQNLFAQAHMAAPLVDQFRDSLEQKGGSLIVEGEEPSAVQRVQESRVEKPRAK